MRGKTRYRLSILLASLVVRWQRASCLRSVVLTQVAYGLLWLEMLSEQHCLSLTCHVCVHSFIRRIFDVMYIEQVIRI